MSLLEEMHGPGMWEETGLHFIFSCAIISTSLHAHWSKLSEHSLRFFIELHYAMGMVEAITDCGR